MTTKGGRLGGEDSLDTRVTAGGPERLTREEEEEKLEEDDGREGGGQL